MGEPIYTKHAEDVVRERKIEKSWVSMALDKPDYSRSGEDGTTHYFLRISQRENRILHVVVKSDDPDKIITVFFDRREKKGG